MKRIWYGLSYVAVLLVGAGAGYLLGFYDNSYAPLWAQVADRDAVEIRNRINVLSMLRLGRTEAAISYLESPLDGQILQVAFGESKFLDLDAERMSPHRLEALQMVKAYRSVYPPAEIKTDPPPKYILEQIPDLQFPAVCDGALCTLVKQREGERAGPPPEQPVDDEE